MLSERSSTHAAWVVACLVVAAAASRLVPVARAQLAAPFDLISEGPHLCTVQAIQRGYDIYARTSFLDLPFFMTPYSPLYHVLVAALPQDAANPFFTGRVVAACLMVLAAASLLAVGGRRRRGLAVAAIGLLFLIHSVTGNTVYLRSDSMALCFSVWAVVLAARARSSRALFATGALCALGVVAKQSFFAATLACGVSLLFTRRRLAPFIGGGIAVGLACALLATAYWGTDFWLAVTIPLTDYPRDMKSFFHHWGMMLDQPLFVFLIVAAVAVTAYAVARGGRAAFAAPFFPYIVLSWAVQTAVMTGIGAENHNLIEPVLATLLWIVVAEGAPAAPFRIGWVRAALLTGLLACVALELRNPDASSYSYTSPAHTAAYVGARDAANARLRALGLAHGRMLNLKNSQVVHDHPGEFAVNDVWMYITVLWNSRPETVDRLVDAIRQERFDVIVVSPGVVTAAFDVGDRPWPRIIHAVFDHYALAFHGAEVNLLTRRAAAGRGAVR